MEIKGKLIAKLNPQVVKSAKGDWTKQEIILETLETYPKKVLIGFWKDEVVKIQAVPIGSEIKAEINVESREYNGRYYTEVKAWKFEVIKEAEQKFKPTDHDLPIDNPPF
jgi:hypothetical protein